MRTVGETYRVGICKTDITPPVGIKLSGKAARTEASTGVYHPLRATAVAIDDGATPLLIVGADLLGFYTLADRVREAIVKATGLPFEQIVLGGSHTHCGPHIRDVDQHRLGPLNEDYVNELVDKIAQASRTAWEERTPARLRFGVGECTLAMCRRYVQGGRCARGIRPFPQGISDHEAPVLTIESPEGDLRGVVYNYAAHPTSRGGLLVGPDYVGFAHDRIEANHPGAIACFVQGCGADQKPRPNDPNAETFAAHEVEETRDLGYELGDAVSEVIRSGNLKPVTGAVKVTRRVLELGIEPLDEAYAREALEGDDRYMRAWATAQLERVEKGLPADTTTSFEIQAIQFGDSLAVVTLAGELCAEHGLRFKRELRPHFGDVLVIGYANALIGYVPVKRQIPEGGYEVEWANRFHGRTGPFVPATEDQIHGAIHEMLGVK